MWKYPIRVWYNILYSFTQIASDFWRLVKIALISSKGVKETSAIFYELNYIMSVCYNINKLTV